MKMKKTIILGSLLISGLAFARGYDNQGTMGRNYRTGFQQNRYSNLSAEQIKKIEAFRAENFKEHQEIVLKIQEKKLEIEKLLTENTVNWNSVKKLNTEITNMEAKLKLEMLKKHVEINAIVGDNTHMIRYGFKNKENFGKHHMNNKNDSYRGNNKNNNNKRNKNKVMKNDRNEYTFNKNSKFGYRQGGFNNLTDDQISKINEIKSNKYEQNQKLKLDLEGNKNKINQLLLKSDINWSEIEKINLDSAKVKANIRLNNYAAREAIEEVTGKEIIKLDQNKKGNMNRFKF